MKASELIAELQKQIDEYGDKEVVDEYGWPFNCLEFEDKEFVLSNN